MRKHWTKVTACMLGLTLAMGGVAPAIAEEAPEEVALQAEATTDEAELEAQVGAAGARAGANEKIAVGETVKSKLTKDDGTGSGGTVFRNYHFSKDTNAYVNLTVKVTKWGTSADGADPTFSVQMHKSAEDFDYAERVGDPKVCTPEEETVAWRAYPMSPFTLKAYGQTFNGQYGFTVSTNAPDTEFEIVAEEQRFFTDESESGKSTRMWGLGALDTMESVLQVQTNVEGFSTADTVIIATTKGYWDALAASSLAGAINAPVLITDGETLSAPTIAEIKRLGAKNAIITGGELAISKGVEKSITDLGLTVKRVAGGGATDTAVEIYKEGKDAWGDTAIIATSNGYWDALSIAPYAAKAKAPIFLTGTTNATGDKQLLPEPAMKALLEDASFKHIIIVGGNLVVSKDCEDNQLKKQYCEKAKIDATAVERLAGGGAIDTSAEIVKWECSQDRGDLQMSANQLFVATNDGYYDALCGAPVCAKNNQVLALVDKDFKQQQAVDAAVKADEVAHINILGGELVISNKAVTDLEAKVANAEV